VYSLVLDYILCLDSCVCVCVCEWLKFAPVCWTVWCRGRRLNQPPLPQNTHTPSYKHNPHPMSRLGQDSLKGFWERGKA